MKMWKIISYIELFNILEPWKNEKTGSDLNILISWENKYMPVEEWGILTHLQRNHAVE